MSLDDSRISAPSFQMKNATFNKKQNVCEGRSEIHIVGEGSCSVLKLVNLRL